MTTLKFEPLPDDISMKDLAMFDSKANILESFKLVNCRINRNYKKEELASVLEQFFMKFPGVFANILPCHEVTIMAELLEILKATMLNTTVMTTISCLFRSCTLS